MYISIPAVTLLLSVAAAQTTFSLAPAPATSICAGQAVLDTCLASTTAIATACKPTDWACLCTSWDAVLTCYLQCPNDAKRSGAQSNKSTYCNNASLYPQSVTSAISRAVSAPASAATTASGTGAQTTGSSGAVRVATSTGATGTSSSASASSTAKSGAQKLNAGGAILGVAGLMGALL